MSAKKSVNVVIGDKLYTLSGYEEKEYLEQVASYINGKIDENFLEYVEAQDCVFEDIDFRIYY